MEKNIRVRKENFKSLMNFYCSGKDINYQTIIKDRDFLLLAAYKFSLPA